MNHSEQIAKKILSLSQVIEKADQWRAENKKIVFTNGVFDILHPGHIFSLTRAGSEGDCLVIGLNTDTSVKKLKGENRPLNDQSARALMLAALIMTDAIVLFDEDTPLELINAIMPDVLVKGGDYTEDEIVGAKEVKANGGRVVINKIIEGWSTTAIIDQARKGFD